MVTKHDCNNKLKLTQVVIDIFTCDSCKYKNYVVADKEIKDAEKYLNSLN